MFAGHRFAATDRVSTVPLRLRRAVSRLLGGVNTREWAQVRPQNTQPSSMPSFDVDVNGSGQARTLSEVGQYSPPPTSQNSSRDKNLAKACNRSASNARKYSGPRRSRRASKILSVITSHMNTHGSLQNAASKGMTRLTGSMALFDLSKSLSGAGNHQAHRLRWREDAKRRNEE